MLCWNCATVNIGSYFMSGMSQMIILQAKFWLVCLFATEDMFGRTYNFFSSNVLFTIWKIYAFWQKICLFCLFKKYMLVYFLRSFGAKMQI